MKISKVLSAALAALAVAALCLVGPVNVPARAAQYTNCMPTTGTISGLTFSADVTQALQSLNTSNSGSTAPATDCSAAPIAGQIWLNTSTTPYQYSIYDGTSWQVIGYVNTTSHVWTPNSNSFGFRNRIYNGDFRFWIRGASGSFNATVGCTTSCQYAADRWLVNATGAGFIATQATAPATGFQFGIVLTGIASNTSAYVAQRIESTNIADQASSTDTLQANIFCSTGQTVKWAAYYPSATDNYTTSTLGPTGTWTVTTSAATYSASLPLSSGAAAGLEIRIYPQNGGAFTSGSCTITGVQLEPGSVTTAFERLPFDVEQRLMTRYCQSTYDYNVAPGTATRNNMVMIFPPQAAGGAGALNFPSPLRTVPTIFNQYDGVGNLGRVSVFYSSVWTDNYSTFTAYPTSKGVIFTSSAAAAGAFMTHYLACAEL